MNTKIMEGLAGASTSMKLLNTPMRVYKEARLKGDTATMERAAGYVGGFAEKAEEYQAKAYKGMKEDAKEARKKAEAERLEAARRRKEEREELEKRIEEKQNENATGISGDGKESSNGNLQTGDITSGEEVHEGAENSIASTEPVMYTKTGEKQAKPDTITSVSFSV
ncbi:MAG: hypothetical protein HFH68_13800 [Lachnospiraceae bacterium]|nr:hypothetical protein [Lachnospiraceae bacterium]